MDLALTDQQCAFRDEVRAFLANSLSPELRRGAALTSGVFAEPDIAREWQAILEARGWLVYHWPEHAGGPGWTQIQRWIFEKECAEAGAPVLPFMGLKLVGPVLYTFGTQAQQDQYLPRLRTGEHIWAQGFSEPGSGSDLASLRTRAVRDGDHYIVSGHKIWTTQAQYADRLFALVRTDIEIKPQQGISFLLIDMTLPGVTVKPIISASGDHELNEVFLDEVRVPVSERVGEEGQGWSIAKFLLENERGGSSFAPLLLADLARLRASTGPLTGELADRAVRLQLEAEALEMTELRTLMEIEQGIAPDPRSLITKLLASEIRQGIEALAIDAFGMAGLQLPARRPFYSADMPAPVGSAQVQIAAARYLNARAWSIFGGTSEIQLTLIAKAALGL
ncbi:alkylation response protein AidB-like acyl-CoA dehydrogenase [Sphingobium xenophagum]|uniref:Alkylation response protein AidB-like acyl-CoA dehydrogenase n=1 Tax=Sphingobium xenophagum TaxID=121428 RepID=A0ABU1X564_SPHXE|nr:acyl-CoA dehydrogenase family protein [Sphingobium xenophagum]MDR7156730.1 alkylation response protein AidB-like acyl-CoA dehydrogenase [Sphingobium xenophagum]